MSDTKKIVESALFISGRWMSAEDLAKTAGSGSIGAVKAALEELKKEYDSRDGGVRMSENDGRYRLEIVPETRDKVYYLAPEPELSPALIKTLALIAYKQPIYQSRVVDVIGNRAYEYIRELRKKEFIHVKKKGRTRLLMTTGHFRKYFALGEGEQFRPELGPEAKLLEEAQKRLDEVMKDPELQDVSDEELEEDAKKARPGKHMVIEDKGAADETA
jgi:segregation and condensation protein B